MKKYNKKLMSTTNSVSRAVTFLMNKIEIMQKRRIEKKEKIAQEAKEARERLQKEYDIQEDL